MVNEPGVDRPVIAHGHAFGVSLQRNLGRGRAIQFEDADFPVADGVYAVVRSRRDAAGIFEPGLDDPVLFVFDQLRISLAQSAEVVHRQLLFGAPRTRCS